MILDQLDKPVFCFFFAEVQGDAGLRLVALSPARLCSVSFVVTLDFLKIWNGSRAFSMNDSLKGEGE